jgi:hypothetical protein
MPRFLRRPSPIGDAGESPAPVAYTDDRGTHVSLAAEASPGRALIHAHERVHRAQFALGDHGGVPAGEDVLEGEARAGARAIMAGGAFTPRNAAAPGMRLHFDPASPLSGTIGSFGEQEMKDLQTLRPRAGDVSSRITAGGREESKTRVADYHYEFETSAKGQRGSITTRTVLDIHYDPNDPRGWITPVSTELRIVQPPEFWKFYPVTISYQRRITYADEYGRTLGVDVYGQSRLDYPQWDVVLARHPDLSQLSLADIARIEADTVFMNASIVGSGDLTSIVERDYPSMPGAIKDEMLRGAPRISYAASGSASGSGRSLHDMSNTIAVGLMSPDPWFAQQVSTTPGLFVHLELNAGRQYDAIRAYLEGHDALAIARLEREIRERLENPAAGPAEPATAAEPDDSILDDVLGWLGDLWDSLPAGLRGTLKAIGKAALVVGAVLALAVIIVALAPVELTVAGVALAIGAVLLGAGFLYSIVQRSLESVATGEGNPGTVFLVAIADTLGISAIYEGITNESILSGRRLDLSEEEQYERGVGGALQLLMLALGLRSLGRGRAPVTEPGRTTTRVPGLYPEAIDPSVPPPGGWRFTDTVTTTGARTTVETVVTAPDGSVGSMGRSYNGQTGEFSMDYAFLDSIPSANRWVQTEPTMVPGRGTPLEAYMTMRQMRILEAGGAAFAGPRTVHLSTIINTRTCLQLGAREAALGRPLTAAELDAAILDTHSVQYANNSIVQSGGRIEGARVSGGSRMRAGDIATADELAAHGVGADQQVPYGFDIDLNVAPARTPLTIPLVPVPTGQEPETPRRQ